jgi:hypothetical protein
LHDCDDAALFAYVYSGCSAVSEASMSSVMVSMSNEGAQPQSRRALESSMVRGHGVAVQV